MWDSFDSLKNHVPHTWNHLELTPVPSSMDEQSSTRRKRLDRYHPTELCDMEESQTCFFGSVRLSEATAVSPNCVHLDRVRMSEATAVSPDRFALWRQLTGSGIHGVSRCARRVFPTAEHHLRAAPA